MRRGRSLQQRMQLQQQQQQQQQESEAGRQQPQQPEQQQEEQQPSEEPLSLQVLLTEKQVDQSAASQDQQAPPLSPCLVKPLPPKPNLVSDSAPSARAPTGSPREERRSPCSRFGKPLTNTRSLPALSVDTWEQSQLGDLAPPPPPEEAEHPGQWTRTPAPPPPPPRYSQTPSPVSSNGRSHVMTEEEPYYTRHPQATPPAPSPTPKLAPPASAYPTRNWSCLHLDQPDVVDSPVDPPITSPLYSPPDSLSIAPPSRPVRTSSLTPPPSQDYRAALPVERWAENVNRYYGSQSATGGGVAAPDEELSELDSLYQASLLAPSMHRGSCGVSPQPSNKPGMRKMLSGSGRSKTPTAEIERFAYRTPVTPLHKTPSGEDESYSAENLRRIARSLSGTVIGSRAQNLGPSRSCDPSVSIPPLRHSDLHSSSSLLLRRPSTSSLHLPSSTSFTTDHSYHHLQHLHHHLHHQPRHHGPSAPAPPPQHPPLQTSRPPSSGPSSWGHSGPGLGVQQQFLVMSDRHQTLSGQSLHSVALNYGTLPRAPRRAPPPSSSSTTSTLPRPRAGSSPAPPPAPQSLYATLSHPRRPANSHHRQVNGSTGVPPQPLRLDVPPETDWRHDADYRTVQPRPAPSRHHPPLQRTLSHQPPLARPRRDPALCSLCQQLPAEPSRPYCPSCGAYVARFRQVS